MIQPIYGRGGFAVASHNGTSYLNESIFYDIESEMVWSQVNATVETNGAFISSKTSGWRLTVNIELLNRNNDDYEAILELVKVINDYDDGNTLYVYPRTSLQSSIYVLNKDNTPKYSCVMESDFDVDDIFERLEKGQSISLSFTSKDIMPLPYYTFDGFPMTGDGTRSNPFGIYNLTGLVFLQDNDDFWDKGYYFKLINDIDMSSLSDWNMIGSYQSNGIAFNGYFDGNNKTISNLTVNKNSAFNGYYVGLFGYTTSSSTFKNITIDNFSIVNLFSSASLPVHTSIFNGGRFENIEVLNSSIEGTYSKYVGGLSSISGIINKNILIDSCNIVGGLETGGVFGYIPQTSILSNISVINSSVISNTGGSVSLVGGVCGLISTSSLSGDAIIDNIYIDSQSLVNGYSFVGGVFGGIIEHTSGDGLIISNIKSMTEIEYKNTYNCYVGGFCGSIRNDAYTTISETYKNILCINVFTELGTGSGTIKIGGILGNIVNPIDTSISSVVGCYFDKSVSLLTTSVIGLGKTTTQLKNDNLYNTYSSEYWTIETGQYPILNIENN